MWTGILIALAAIVLIFFIVVALRPADFRITRSTTVSAAPEAIFSQVNDFHNWDAWSPWAKLDPNVKNTYDGAPAGTGAVFAWSGDKKVGEGRMTITGSVPGERVTIDLVFIRPIAARNVAEFVFKSQGARTLVTWSMSGRYKFMARAFGLFFDFDKLVGKDFEKGLAQMKANAEAAPNL